MSHLVRKTIRLDPALIHELTRMADAKGGHRRGHTFSSEVNQALRFYIKRQTAQQEEATMTPVWEQLLNEKFAQMEAWLRPGVWGGGTYAATSALMLLEVLCGKQLDPSQAKDHFELLRGRAWKILRQGSQSEGR